VTERMEQLYLEPESGVKIAISTLDRLQSMNLAPDVFWPSRVAMVTRGDGEAGDSAGE